MPEHDVTHGEIYRALGILEGKIDAMNQALLQKHTDISTAFTRIDNLARTVWIGVGIAVACSVVVPLLVTASNPRLHFQHQEVTQDERRP
jgi:hypothetical protein